MARKDYRYSDFQGQGLGKFQSGGIKARRPTLFVMKGGKKVWQTKVDGVLITAKTRKALINKIKKATAKERVEAAINYRKQTAEFVKNRAEQQQLKGTASRLFKSKKGQKQQLQLCSFLV